MEEKKRLVMISSDDLRLVQGVNYVIQSFVNSKSLFTKIDFTDIYGGNQSVSVESGEQVPIGVNVGTTQYTLKRKIRVFLKKLLSSRIYMFAMLKYQANFEAPAKRALQRYLGSGKVADYILFHDILTAYYFFTTCPRPITEKTAFIVHAADDDMGQLLEQLPAFKGRKTKEILAQRDYVYEHLDKIVYISQKACDNSKVPEQKKCVIYNGVEDIDYRFDDKIKEAINFVCVGSMSGWKGQDVVIQALTRLSNEKRARIHLYLVGDGPERSNLEQMVKDNNLVESVTFTGSRNDVPEILRNQDVFIMPSKNEGLSIATLEGIRAGLFMMLTDAGGNKEVMGDDGGFVIERDADDIGKKICRIIDEGLVCKNQKECSRAHFLKLFTTTSMISKYENMFTSMDNKA